MQEPLLFFTFGQVLLTQIRVATDRYMKLT